MAAKSQEHENAGKEKAGFAPHGGSGGKRSARARKKPGLAIPAETDECAAKLSLGQRGR
jgi:hypothetical protein